jgi:hypothetical protein
LASVPSNVSLQRSGDLRRAPSAPIIGLARS